MKIEKIETNTNTLYKVKGTNYTMEIECETGNTRTGFKHETTLTIWSDKLHCGNTTTFNKSIYYNRTWEYFRYESCINGAFEKLLKYTIKKEQPTIKRIRTTLFDKIKNHNFKYRYINI